MYFDFMVRTENVEPWECNVFLWYSSSINNFSVENLSLNILRGSVTTYLLIEFKETSLSLKSDFCLYESLNKKYSDNEV